MHAHTLRKRQAWPSEDRRLTNRIPIHAVVTCRYYSSSREQPSQAIMLNFSENGSYIESTEKFNVGAVIILMLLSYPVDSLPNENFSQPRSICLTEVRWNRSLEEDGTLRYGLGLKYY